MLRLVSDENFNGEIVRGLLRRERELDLARVQDVGLAEADDPVILEWAADNQRVLLTHDRRTVPGFAWERVRAGKAMTGVLVVSDRMPIGQAIEELCLIASCSLPNEWQSRVDYLPLK